MVLTNSDRLFMARYLERHGRRDRELALRELNPHARMVLETGAAAAFHKAYELRLLARIRS